MFQQFLKLFHSFLLIPRHIGMVGKKYIPALTPMSIVHYDLMSMSRGMGIMGIIHSNTSSILNNRYITHSISSINLISNSGALHNSSNTTAIRSKTGGDFRIF
jgi:hypothetical protein